MTKDNTKKEMSEERLNELLKNERELQKIKTRQKNAWKRRNARLMIFKQKAESKGLTVSEKEIDEYLND